MKKFITIILSIILIFAISIPTFAVTITYKDANGKTQKINDFLDTKNHWAHDVILKWADYQVISGYSNGCFGPNDPITRGDFCLILDRMLTLSAMSYNYFYDLPSDAYYTEAILKCVAAGYVSGTSDTTVTPRGNATREQVAVIIYRMLNLDSSGYNNVRKFSDDYNIGSWAREAVYTMRKYGYMNGNGSNMFNPKANITRGEIIQVLSNITGTFIPKKDVSGDGNTFRGDFKGNVTTGRTITLTHSNVGNDLILTQSAKSISISDSVINNRIYVMGKTAVSLSNVAAKEMYLVEGKSNITGMSDKIQSVYVSEYASESTIDDYPKQITLAAGTRVRIAGKMYENETNKDKVYYGLDIQNDIAAEQNYIAGGPKVSGATFEQDANNMITVSKIKITKGDADISEIGVIWLNEREENEVIQPTYQNYTGIRKTENKNIVDQIKIEVGKVSGYQGFRVYVKDTDGLYGYSSTYTFKEYDFEIVLKIYDNDYPSKIDVDVVFSGNSVPDISNVKVIYGVDEIYDTERKEVSLHLYSDNTAEYQIDSTKYKRYTATIKASNAEEPPTYFGYLITFKDKSIINKYPVLSNVLPEGVSPMAKLRTGGATYQNDRISIVNNLVSTKYIVPQEYGVIYKASDSIITEKPTAGKNGWTCIDYDYPLTVNESKYFTVNMPVNKDKTYSNYAVYVKTSNGYWYGDLFAIYNEFNADEDGYNIGKVKAEVLGDKEVLLTIHYGIGTNIISEYSYVDLGNTIGICELNDLEYYIYDRKLYIVLRDLDDSIYNIPVRIIKPDGAKSNAVSVSFSMTDRFEVSATNKRSNESYYVYKLYSKDVLAQSIDWKELHIIGSSEDVQIKNGNELWVPKTVDVSSARVVGTYKKTYSTDLNNKIEIPFTLTFDLY